MAYHGHKISIPTEVYKRHSIWDSFPSYLPLTFFLVVPPNPNALIRGATRLCRN